MSGGVRVGESPLDRAQRRRVLLNHAKLSTYVLSHSFEGGDSITCLCCGYRSHNRHDVDSRYCGFCHSFHSDVVGIESS